MTKNQYEKLLTLIYDYGDACGNNQECPCTMYAKAEVKAMTNIENYLKRFVKEN